MILGSGDPTPYDRYALFALAVLGILLLAGCLAGDHWPAQLATALRRGAAALALLLLAAVLILTPTRNGIVGAGRLLTLWPAATLDLALFAVWSWRAARL